MELNKWKFFDEVRGKVYNQSEIEINEKKELFLKTTNEKLDEDGVFIYPTNLLDKEGSKIWEQDLVADDDNIYLVEKVYGLKTNRYQMVKFPLTEYQNEKPIKLNKDIANKLRKIGCALKFDTVHNFLFAHSLSKTL